MSSPGAPPSSAPPVVDARIARGAATNFLGTLAKILHPAFFVLANRLYGPAEFGLYVLATTIVELAAGLINAAYYNDTFYDGASTAHAIQNELQCNGEQRSILCCYPVCQP